MEGNIGNSSGRVILVPSTSGCKIIRDLLRVRGCITNSVMDGGVKLALAWAWRYRTMSGLKVGSIHRLERKTQRYTVQRAIAVCVCVCAFVLRCSLVRSSQFWLQFIMDVLLPSYGKPCALSRIWKRRVEETMLVEARRTFWQRTVVRALLNEPTN